MSTISAFVAVLFLVLLYKDPPGAGQEYLYFLPLLAPLLMAFVLTRGINAGRAHEDELLELVTGIAEGRIRQL
jgi:hypothetical protein